MGGGFQHQSVLQVNQLITELMRLDLLLQFFMHGVHDQTRSSQLHSKAILRPGGIAQSLERELKKDRPTD